MIVVNAIENWKVKVNKQVKRQKNDKDIVVLQGNMIGKENPDGTFVKGLPLTIVVNENTNWLPCDYTDFTILVSGKAVAGQNFFVYASNIKEYTFDKTANKVIAENNEKPVEQTNTKGKSIKELRKEYEEQKKEEEQRQYEWHKVAEEDECPFL